MYGKGECVYWMKNSSEVVQEVKVSSIGDMTRFKTGRDVRQGNIIDVLQPIKDPRHHGERLNGRL